MGNASRSPVDGISLLHAILFDDVLPLGLGEIVMKQILAASAFALLSGCASFSPPPSFNQAQPTADPLFDALEDVRIHTDGFRKRADQLGNDSVWFDSLTNVAAIATLGFGAFDAPQDNTLAAAVVTGVVGASRDQLKPRSAAAFYRRATAALKCVSDEASVFRSHQAILPIADLTNLQRASMIMRSNYHTILSDLQDLRKEADAIEIPSKELTAALTKAQEVEGKLDLAVKARDNLVDTINKSVLAVGITVESRPPPDMKKFTDAIAAVELPNVEAEPSGGAGDAAPTELASLVLEKFSGNKLSAVGKTQLSGLLSQAIADYKEEQNRLSKELAGRINAKLRLADSNKLDREANAAKHITACATAFEAAGF